MTLAELAVSFVLVGITILMIICKIGMLQQKKQIAHKKQLEFAQQQREREEQKEYEEKKRREEAEEKIAKPIRINLRKRIRA
ncbi:MAG: hypothetical protein WA063_06500, partial [Minisyncoccia bacterium]